jgi:hypothetical protein
LQKQQPRLDPKRLVFIDETSVSTTITRLYGRAAQGERLVQKVPHGNWKTITFIAALRHDRVTAPFVLEGPMTGEMFKAYTEQFLAPTLTRGDIVFMDNVTSTSRSYWIIAGVPKIACAFGRFECSNEGANTSLQSVDCALGRLAQPRLEGMEHQFNWVKVRRILRQVSQFCAAGLDCLLHASDFMEGDVVDDDDVPPPERRGETLFDISEERFSVHGSLDHHWGDDTGSTKARDECQRFPVSHWNLADKAFSAWAPTVGTDHVGGDGSFIDKYKASGVKQPLLADPASARPRHVGSLSLRGAQAFF